MHAPPGFGAAAADHRLVRRVRGSEPAAGKRRLRQGREPLPRRDLRSRRRSIASTRCSGCCARTASRPRGSRPCRGAAAAIARRDSTRHVAGRRPSCSTRSTAARTRASSPSAVRTRSAGTTQLKAQNCITDVRGDVLRIGFGIYQDEDDVDRLVELLGGLRERAASAAAQRASLVLALLLLAYIFNYLDRQILGILAGPIIADLHLTDTPVRGAQRPALRASSIRCSAIPFAYLADRTSRSRVIAAALPFWSAFTASVRHGHVLLAAVRLPHGRRHWRSRRRRAVLRADRRLFRAAAPRAGAWRSSRSESRSACRSGR